MLLHPPAASRALTQKNLTADLVVVGGGLAGTCAAITAARVSERIRGSSRSAYETVARLQSAARAICCRVITAGRRWL